MSAVTVTVSEDQMGAARAKPALRNFAAAYAKMWAKGGPLEKRGLVPLSATDAATSGKQSTELKPLDPAGLK